MPCGPVVAVAWVEPPVKVAPAPPLPAEAPAAEAEPSVKVTVAPATGLPDGVANRDPQAVGVVRCRSSPWRLLDPTGVIVCGLAARLSSVKRAGSVTCCDGGGGGERAARGVRA